MSSEDPDWIELEDDHGRSYKYMISELVEVDDKNYLALVPESGTQQQQPPLVLVRYHLDEDQVEEIADAVEYSKVFGLLTKKYGEKGLLS